jgi:hypothetical protein
MPLPTVLTVVALAAVILLIASLLTRTVVLILGCAVWIIVFAPAQVLNALARRTGAESFINAGKYLLLVILSIYAVIQE